MAIEDKLVHISGAGPAGLAAAITVANAGGRAVVYERRNDVGGRFHGDFQGLENWTTRGDVIEEIRGLGIKAEFEHTPFREVIVHGPNGREHVYRSPDPIFYLVRRGRDSGTLDSSLKAQALSYGVEIRFGDALQKLPDGGIVADGPRAADGIVVGHIFETDLSDGAFAAVSDDLAPGGYSYLLVSKGRGTVASCMFRDFHNEKVYLERTVDFFRRRAELQMRNQRRFGGVGNVLLPSTARQGRILFSGEAAGFQDALWGFGMRYAILSGHLAAWAVLLGAEEDYDDMWRHRFGRSLQAAMVNRYLADAFGQGVYNTLLNRIDGTDDLRRPLHAHCAGGWWRRLLVPLARRAVLSSRKAAACAMEGCNCTWCRCNHARTNRAAEALA